MSEDRFPGWHGTTILAVRRGGKVVVAGDGQVSVGPTVMKGTARKVRRLTPGGHDVVVGFAGSTADAFTLLERLERKLEAAPGQLQRAWNIGTVFKAVVHDDAIEAFAHLLDRQTVLHRYMWNIVGFHHHDDHRLMDNFIMLYVVHQRRRRTF